eukprot:Em0016g529a
MYALSILPLIQRSSVDVNQVWYADDAAATGTVLNLKEWWDNINNFGPSYGYYANAKKTWLVVKEAHYTSALSAFHGTNLNITTTGKPHLGAPLGTQSFVTPYVKAIIDNWVNNVIAISHIATTQPHAAYSAFTHGFVHKWSYLARTVPDITRLFQPLEDVIRTKFIPCLTGRAPPNDLERNLLSLPPRLGGLGIPNPTITSDTEYTASRSVCKPLYNLILLHDSSYHTEAIEQQVKAKKEVHSFKLKHSQGSASNLRPQCSMDLAQEKGASNWLTTLPIDENGFTVHFMMLSLLVEHALSCPLDGFPSIRHNEIRDLTANLMTETPTPSSCYRKHENIKKREYELRIREIERASFTPIVLSSTGGMGSIATTTYKRLASLLADKWGTSYRNSCSIHESEWKLLIDFIEESFRICPSAFVQSSSQKREDSGFIFWLLSSVLRVLLYCGSWGARARLCESMCQILRVVRGKKATLFQVLLKGFTALLKDTAELSRVCLHHGFPFPVYLSHFKDMHVAWMKKHHTEAVSSGDWLVDIQSTVHLTMLESSVLFVLGSCIPDLCLMNSRSFDQLCQAADTLMQFGSMAVKKEALVFLKPILLERYPSRQIFEHMLSSFVAVLSYVLKLKSTNQRVPAEFECALGSCLRCAFTLHVPSLVTSRMWRLIFNVICESLSTRTYANCTSELQDCIGDLLLRLRHCDLPHAAVAQGIILNMIGEVSNLQPLVGYICHCINNENHAGTSTLKDSKSLQMLLRCATYCEQLLRDACSQLVPAQESSVAYEKVLCATEGIRMMLDVVGRCRIWTKSKFDDCFSVLYDALRVALNTFDLMKTSMDGRQLETVLACVVDAIGAVQLLSGSLPSHFNEGLASQLVSCSPHELFAVELEHEPSESKKLLQMKLDEAISQTGGKLAVKLLQLQAQCSAVGARKVKEGICSEVVAIQITSVRCLSTTLRTCHPEESAQLLEALVQGIDGFTDEVLAVVQEELPVILLCAAGIKLPMDISTDDGDCKVPAHYLYRPKLQTSPSQFKVATAAAIHLIDTLRKLYLNVKLVPVLLESVAQLSIYVGSKHMEIFFTSESSVGGQLILSKLQEQLVVGLAHTTNPRLSEGNTLLTCILSLMQLLFESSSSTVRASVCVQIQKIAQAQGLKPGKLFSILKEPISEFLVEVFHKKPDLLLIERKDLFLIEVASSFEFKDTKHLLQTSVDVLVPLIVCQAAPSSSTVLNFLAKACDTDEADFELAVLLNSDLKNVLNHLILHLSTHKDRVLAGLCMLMTQSEAEHSEEQPLGEFLQPHLLGVLAFFSARLVRSDYMLDGSKTKLVICSLMELMKLLGPKYITPVKLKVEGILSVEIVSLGPLLGQIVVALSSLAETHAAAITEILRYLIVENQ